MEINITKGDSASGEGWSVSSTSRPLSKNNSDFHGIIQYNTYINMLVIH